ncbi:MAG TPA: MFS transporter [Candidatus Dormibacteraeota bacterium]
MIPGLLRRRGAFRWFWAGQTISLLGDQVTVLAVPLVAVLYLRAGPREMGYLVAAAWLPYLLFGLPAGAWVDRLGRRRRVMSGADLGRAALLLTVPLAAALHGLTLLQLYVAVFGNGILGAFFQVSSQTLFVSMLEREDYVAGQQLIYGSRAFSFVAGPSLGGFLVQVLSGPVALVLDATSFLVSAVALGSIRPVEPEPDRERRGLLTAGARFIESSPVLRAGLLATATINLFNLAYNALFVLYAVRYLHFQPAVLGTVVGIGAVGGIAGSLVAGRIGRRIGPGPAFMAGCVLFTLPLVLVPLAGGPSGLVVGMVATAGFFASFGVMVLDITWGSITASLIPNRLRARVQGAYSVVNYGVRPAGSVLGGALAAVAGVRPTLFVVTLGAVLGVLWLLPSPLPRMRELPAEG